MIHGPCGALNPKSPCMDRLTCSKKYPKAFCNVSTESGGYPLYRRSQGASFTKRIRRRNITIDSRWVVPYNPYLLQKYDCHLNVEICSSVASVKYLYKYVYKGSDRSTFVLGENIDEIQNYQNGR